MKNRAKCNLCKSIIESFHSTDYVTCKCGEISVYGAESLSCSARDFKNFLRIDDNGHEILVVEKNAEDIICEEKKYIGTVMGKEELIKELDHLRERIESLPNSVMYEPVTHADFCSLLLLLSSILRA